MKRFLLCAALLFTAAHINAQVTVYPGEKLSAVKDMNAVNNAPIIGKKAQTRSNLETFKAARIPYVRPHDAALSSTYGGPHCIDISGIFSNFDADVNSPESYDFTITDKYIESVYTGGAQMFFRLGQSIENAAKKYNVYPPKDYRKWAQICEHIILHYNEGWTDGYHYGIKYWEIWNEADLDKREKDWKYAPRNWGGSPQEFFKFYETAAKYLKKRFPSLMIGGPALCENLDWAEDFFIYMESHKVPMDFFSWHCYTNTPEKIKEKANIIHGLMKKYGYGSAESILDEWNYLRDWKDNFTYTVEQVRGIKGGAFCAAVMATAQKEGIDMLMYYDVRPSTSFCGLFNMVSLKPQPAYYAFYLWSRLRDYGNVVRSSVPEEEKDLYAVAAEDEKGNIAVMACRFNDDDNVSAPKVVTISGLRDGKYFAHITDDVRSFTEIPVEVKDGEAHVVMQPQSFVFIEIR